MVKYLNFDKKAKKFEKDIELDEEGNAVINLAVEDKKSIISSFKVDDKFAINNEFASLLDNCIKRIPPKNNIHLKIKCKNINEEEKRNCAEAIRYYYLNMAYDNERLLKINFGKFIFLVIFSILSFALLFVTHFFNINWIVTEVVEIVTWVFTWGAVEIFAFERSKLRLQKQRNLSLNDCKITFE